MGIKRFLTLSVPSNRAYEVRPSLGLAQGHMGRLSVPSNRAYEVRLQGQCDRKRNVDVLSVPSNPAYEVRLPCPAGLSRAQRAFSTLESGL